MGITHPSIAGSTQRQAAAFVAAIPQNPGNQAQNPAYDVATSPCCPARPRWPTNGLRQAHYALGKSISQGPSQSLRTECHALVGQTPLTR